MERSARRTHHTGDGDDEVFEVEGRAALRIEFEDEDGSPAATLPRGTRPRDLRPFALFALAVAVLGGALAAVRPATPPQPGGQPTTVSAAAPNYGAFVVTVAYRGARLLSLDGRQIEVDLRVTPVPGAAVRVLAYYVSENGVIANADPVPSTTPIPAAGIDVGLRLTVTDCAVVPIGETMGFVDVVARGPVGTMDRFTILGDRYSADLSRLLTEVCPGRPDGRDQGAAASAQTTAS